MFVISRLLFQLISPSIHSHTTSLFIILNSLMYQNFNQINSPNNLFLFLNSSTYKKVLLRERKRHTDRGVSSTPSITWGGVPPLPGRGTPPNQVRCGGVPEVGSPQPGLMGVHSWGGVPLGVTPCQVWQGGIWGGVPLGTPPEGGTPQPGLMGGTQGGVPPRRDTSPRQVPLAGVPPPAWTWLGYTCSIAWKGHIIFY